MRFLPAICVSLLVSGALSQTELEGSGELPDDMNYEELDESIFVHEQRDLDHIDSYEEENKEEDIAERGLEEAEKEEDFADNLDKENIEQARSFEEEEEEPDNLEERSLEEEEEVESPLDEEEVASRELSRAEGASEEVSKRGVFGMRDIMAAYIGFGNPIQLLTYGCFCGLGSRGKTPVDEIDKCCQYHDECYADGTKGSFWTRKCKISFHLQYYKHKCEGSSCKCLSPAKSCAGMACKCDLDFAICLKKNWGSYNGYKKCK